MKIIRASLVGFKGLQKISEEGVFKISLDESHIIHSFSGENGTGKSTLVSILNPFIMPNGFREKDISKFINFPGEKKIIFYVGGIKYKSKISYKQKGQTEAKLYSMSSSEWVLVDGFASGKATVYTDLLEGILGVSQKTVSTINFIGQNTNGLITASPKDRRELIYPLMHNMYEYDEIINDYSSLEADVKLSLASLDGQLSGLALDKMEVGFLDAYRSDTDAIKKTIVTSEERLSEISSNGKKLRVKVNEITRLKAIAEEKMAGSDKIKAGDHFDGFPNALHTSFRKSDLSESEKEYNAIVALNDKTKVIINNFRMEISVFESKVSEGTSQNKAFIDEFGSEKLNLSKDTNSSTQLHKNTLVELERKLELLKKDVESISAVRSYRNDIRDIQQKIDSISSTDAPSIKELTASRSKIMEILSIRNSDYLPISSIYNKLISNEDLVKLKDTIDNDFYSLFGKSFLSDKSERRVEILEVEGDLLDVDNDISTLTKNIATIESLRSNIVNIEKKIIGVDVSDNDALTNIKPLQDSIASTKDLLEKSIELDRVKSISDIFFNNTDLISKSNNNIKKINGQINTTTLADTRLVIEKIDRIKLEIPLMDANIIREEYRKLLSEIHEITSSKDYSSFDVINSEMINIESSYTENNNSLKALNKSLNESIQKDDRYQNINSRVKKIKLAEDEVSENNTKLKTYNKMKIYGKNIKETILSRFMIQITDLANEYLASDDLSSIKMTLSIQQNGKNFNIFAHQDGFEKQEINTLSGAESSTVNRALATSIAFSSNTSLYNLYSFDETDGALSDSNKQSFIENLKNISMNDMVDQLFIISQDQKVSEYLGSNKITLERT